MCQKPKNLVLKDRDGDPLYVDFTDDAIELQDWLGREVVLDDMALIIAVHKAIGQYIEWRQQWERLPGEVEDA